MEGSVFTFKTKRGNLYQYDDVTGSVFKSEQNLKLARNKFLDANNRNKENFRQITTEGSEPLGGQIKDHLTKQGFKQLTLIVSHRCNLCCQYCIYSEEYTHTRTHESRDMSLQTAKEVLRLYFDRFSKVKNHNPRATPTIGFYGGEPLLNFALIEKITKLASEYWDSPINFHLTTNGTLLSKEIIDFLEKHGFFLSVSLDGPRDEHNKNRIYPSGKGSFDDIVQNLAMLSKEYRKEHCTLLANYDVSTDLTHFLNFFKNKQYDLPPLGKLSPINASFTDW